MEYSFGPPEGPHNSILFNEATGWHLFMRGDNLCVSGDCTREQAEAALAENRAAAVAAEAERVAAEEASVAAKASAIAKLAALGLTEDEAAAIVGA